MSTGFRNVELKPTAFACIKSSILSDSFYIPKSSSKSSKGGTLLEPSSQGVAIPKGLKVFVNIAWDANVPPPPEGSEDVIQKAMQGEDLDDLNPEGWYVPTVVSDGRQDTDKAGKLSLVFDAVFNSSLKSRTLKSPEFKTFLIELAFQRIEAQTSGTILLSRQIGTPNIASKGKLEPRTVQIPNILYSEGHPNGKSQALNNVPRKALIEEIKDPVEGPSRDQKGILKGTHSTPKHASKSINSLSVPFWTWSKSNTKIRVVIDVPDLTYALIPVSTLDLEPRRIILTIPGLYQLDVNLDASDAELMATFSRSESDSAFANPEFNSEDGSGRRSMVDSALTLKRIRDLEVSSARAEWRVAEGILVILA